MFIFYSDHLQTYFRPKEQAREREEEKEREKEKAKEKEQEKEKEKEMVRAAAVENLKEMVLAEVAAEKKAEHLVSSPSGARQPVAANNPPNPAASSDVPQAVAVESREGGRGCSCCVCGKPSEKRCTFFHSTTIWPTPLKYLP